MQSISLIEYQSAWPAQFDAVAAELALALEAIPVHIEHIGSTSVAGLCAKPVLDIMLGVQGLASVMSRVTGLERLGYQYRPEYEVEMPHRRYFVRPEGRQLRIHLHAVVQESEAWCNHLAFRDALRTNPALAAEYATLKRALAEAHRGNKAAYTEAKAPFIAGVLVRFPASRCPAVLGAA